MKKLILTIAIILSSVTVPMLLVGQSAYATNSSTPSENATTSPSAKAKVQEGINSAGGNDNSISASTIIKNIINTMLFLVGVLSVIMIIYGSIQYVISTGDSGKVAKAKNTIMYSIVGLVVSILSYAIVEFVMNQIK